MPKKSQTVLDSPVTFGGVSIGDNTARLGVRFARDVLKLNAADELLCNHRLTGAAILGRNGDAPGQQALIDDASHSVAGTFDVKGFRCTMDTIATGLTFSLNDIDVAELAKLSKGEGRLLIEEEAARFIAQYVASLNGHWKSLIGMAANIKLAVREASQRLHPDRGGDAKLFQRLMEAERTLMGGCD